MYVARDYLHHKWDWGVVFKLQKLRSLSHKYAFKVVILFLSLEQLGG